MAHIARFQLSSEVPRLHACAQGDAALALACFSYTLGLTQPAEAVPNTFAGVDMKQLQRAFDAANAVAATGMQVLKQAPAPNSATAAAAAVGSATQPRASAEELLIQLGWLARPAERGLVEDVVLCVPGTAALLRHLRAGRHEVLQFIKVRLISNTPASSLYVFPRIC